MVKVCECGLNSKKSRDLSACSQLGLRNHATFLPAILLNREEVPTELSEQITRNNSRPWAVMGEIVQTVPGRQMACSIKSRFRADKVVFVAFDNHDVEVVETLTIQGRSSRDDFIPGNTMVLLYPTYFWEKHRGDTMHGLTEESLDGVVIIPAKLNSILAYSDLIGSKERFCHHCKIPISGNQCCGGCNTARYCGRECQTADWTNHKKLCKWTILIKQLMELPEIRISEINARGRCAKFQIKNSLVELLVPGGKPKVAHDIRPSHPPAPAATSRGEIVSAGLSSGTVGITSNTSRTNSAGITGVSAPGADAGAGSSVCAVGCAGSHELSWVDDVD